MRKLFYWKWSCKYYVNFLWQTIKNYWKLDTELLVKVKFLFKVHSSQTLLFHWSALSTNIDLYKNLTWLVYQENIFLLPWKKLQMTSNKHIMFLKGFIWTIFYMHKSMLLKESEKADKAVENSILFSNSWMWLRRLSDLNISLGIWIYSGYTCIFYILHKLYGSFNIPLQVTKCLDLNWLLYQLKLRFLETVHVPCV